MEEKETRTAGYGMVEIDEEMSTEGMDSVMRSVASQIEGNEEESSEKEEKERDEKGEEKQERRGQDTHCNFLVGGIQLTPQQELPS